jgi:hypothetical protein
LSKAQRSARSLDGAAGGRPAPAARKQQRRGAQEQFVNEGQRIGNDEIDDEQHREEHRERSRPEARKSQ